MKKIVLILCLFYSGIAFSQINISNAKQDNWRLGGNVGMSFGSDDYFGFAISPSLGYKITEDLEGGLTVGYRYSNWRDSKRNMFNAGPYLNYYTLNSIFVRAHYEHYTGTRKFKETSLTRSFDENALWIGAGFRSGGKVKVYAGMMYNVLYEKDDSMFANGIRPIVGVSFGI
ncbi:MAG: hypothetical protein L0J45_01735 [Psychroflexus sp.]|nr:hypothetical protein [Psychroflexus sp.]MDN6309712.1 hypothetical protein [Psychroflexus sp.]